MRENICHILDIFRSLDVDSSGYVDRHEFRRGLGALLGPDHSYADEEIDEFFEAIDTSGDGRISYQELKRTLRPPPPMGDCEQPLRRMSSQAS